MSARHFSFVYRIGNDRDHARAKMWATRAGAQNAADKWAADMLAQDCPVETRVFELVSDGRHGLVEQVSA